MSNDSGQLHTIRRVIYDSFPITIMRALWGLRYSGTLALLWDALTQSTRDAADGPYLQDDNGPAYDALRPLGDEMSMPQYPEEGWVGYRARLRNAWDTWAKAGDESTIIDQLGLAGLLGAQIFRFSENASWSEFIVFYPAGSHPVTGSNTVGSFNVGDGTTAGVAGITSVLLTALKGLITHWKPARWKCPWVIWELSGWTIGTGHIVGESSLLIGGSQLRTRIQV